MIEPITYRPERVYATDMHAISEHVDLYLDDTKEHYDPATAYVHGPAITHDDLLYRYVFIRNDRLHAATNWYRKQDEAQEECNVMMRKATGFDSILPQTGTLTSPRNEPLLPAWTYEQVMQAISEHIVVKNEPSVTLDVTNADMATIRDWIAEIGYCAQPNDTKHTIKITKR